jgi:hypothetical protein
MTKLKFLDLTSNASDTPNKFEEPEQCLEDVVNKLQELKELRMRLPEVDRFEMCMQYRSFRGSGNQSRKDEADCSEHS